VLWGGYAHEGNCYVMTAYRPEICPEKLFKRGLIIEEKLEDMRRNISSKLREELSRRGQMEIAILRSFPPGASSRDIRYVMEGMTDYFELNTLFIVVPNYALEHVEFEQLDKYKLVEESKLIIVPEAGISEIMPIRMWKELKPGEVIFEIVDHITLL